MGSGCKAETQKESPNPSRSQPSAMTKGNGVGEVLRNRALGRRWEAKAKGKVRI